MTYILVFILIISGLAYWAGHFHIRKMVHGDGSRLHSTPHHHGIFLALTTTAPALLFFLLWLAASDPVIDILIEQRFATELSVFNFSETQALLRDSVARAFGKTVLSTNDLVPVIASAHWRLHSFGIVLLVAIVFLSMIVGGVYGWWKIKPAMRARQSVERVMMGILFSCSAVAVLTTAGIVLSLIFETIRFFGKVPFYDFLFGLHWSPQSAFEGAGSAELNDDYSRIFGAIPLFTGTLLITTIAIFIAAPIGLMSAIYLSEYASARFRGIAKPLLEILAGIPTVVYGFFAVLTVAPSIRGIGEQFGLDVSSESALAAGLVMGIMIIPFISSLSDDVINAVPQALRDGSTGLGATPSETIRKVVIPAALPGIVSSLLLAISRAIGETMIVVMAAGLAANLTVNPMEAVTTVTVQMVTLLVGDQEFDSAKTLAAFALGLLLFCITLTLNVIALKIVQKYRERYD